MPQDYSLKLYYYLFGTMDCLQILINTPDTPHQNYLNSCLCLQLEYFQNGNFFLAVLTKMRLRLGRKLCSPE